MASVTSNDGIFISKEKEQNPSGEVVLFLEGGIIDKYRCNVIGDKV